MENIEFEGQLLAYVIRKEHFSSGYNFISKNEWLLQVGVNFYKKDQECVPHEHLLRPIIQESPNESLELLYFVRGGAEITLFWKDRQVATASLHQGDSILLIKGGHSLKMNEETQILEVKQGPYYSRETDKRIFSPKKGE